MEDIPGVVMQFDENNHTYRFVWECSECGYAGIKEVEDTADLSPLPVGRPTELALYCDNCCTFDKTRIQINIVHLHPLIMNTPKGEGDSLVHTNDRSHPSPGKDVRGSASSTKVEK